MQCQGTPRRCSQLPQGARDKVSLRLKTYSGRQKHYRIRVLNTISGPCDGCGSFSAMRSSLDDHWRRSPSAAVTASAVAVPRNATAPIRTSRQFNFSDNVRNKCIGILTPIHNLSVRDGQCSESQTVHYDRSFSMAATAYSNIVWAKSSHI